MVADLLLLRPLITEKLLASAENDDVEMQDPSERPFSIYIVPFLSLISEKEKKISGVVKELGMTYISIHSHKRPIISESEPPDVVFCTIQKSNQLINNLIEANQISRLRTIVIDELHMIGDESRGYILELLLTKLVYIKRDTPSLKLQIVAMSATFPNLAQVASWLSAELYVTSFRPVTIREYIKTVGSPPGFYQIMPAV